MENEIIANAQIKSSSDYCTNHPFMVAKKHTGCNVVWCSEASDPAPWLKIDLLSSLTVCILRTYGSPNHLDRVRKFTLQYSAAGNTWVEYQENNRTRVCIWEHEAVQTVEIDSIRLEKKTDLYVYHFYYSMACVGIGDGGRGLIPPNFCSEKVK